MKTRHFSSYKNWKAAVRKLSDSVRFDGDSEICFAFPFDDKKSMSHYCEWDGEKGTIEQGKPV